MPPLYFDRHQTPALKQQYPLLGVLFEICPPSFLNQYTLKTLFNYEACNSGEINLNEQNISMTNIERINVRLIFSLHFSRPSNQ